MRKVRNTIAVLLTATLFCNVGTLPTFAAGTYSLTPVKENAPFSLNANVSANSFGYSFRFVTEQQTYQGVDEARDYYYQVPRADMGTNNYLELHYRHSELLDPSDSTLTVFIDDKPLASSFLTKDNAHRGQLRIQLGKDELTPGYHKVTIAKHSTVSEEICEDEENPANWVRVDPTSYVFLDTKTEYTLHDPLTHYPYPFVEAGTPEEAYGAVVIPDQTSPDVIAAALRITSFLSNSTAMKHTIPIMKESAWEQSNKQLHVIMVGPASEWKGQIKQQIESLRVNTDKQLFALDTFVLKNNASQKAKLVLLATGESAQTIADHVSVLTNPALTKQLSGSHLRVEHAPKTITNEAENTAKKLTLASAGYDHLLITPIKKESDKFTIQVPTHWKITGDSTLDLNVKLSPLFWSKELKSKQKDNQALDDRGLTVKINGQPTTFTAAQLGKLAGEKDAFVLKVPVSKELLDESSTLEVALMGHFGLTKEACTPDRGEGQWIFIDKASSLTVPHELPAENTFAYWPAPFVTDTGMGETAFLLPEKMDDASYQQLSLLVNQLTKHTDHPEQFNVYQEPLTENQQKELSSYHVIALGGAQALPTLQAKHGDLLMKEKDQALSLHELGIINETTSYVAWVQPSPWNAARSLAVLQSVQPQAKSAGFLDQKLLDYLGQSREEGQIAVMSRSDEVFLVNLKQQTDQEQAEPQFETQVPMWLIVVFVAVGVILLTVIVKLRRKEKTKNDRSS